MPATPGRASLRVAASRRGPARWSDGPGMSPRVSDAAGFLFTSARGEPFCPSPSCARCLAHHADPCHRLERVGSDSARLSCSRRRVYFVGPEDRALIVGRSVFRQRRRRPAHQPRTPIGDGHRQTTQARCLLLKPGARSQEERRPKGSPEATDVGGWSQGGRRPGGHGEAARLLERVLL